MSDAYMIRLAWPLLAVVVFVAGLPARVLAQDQGAPLAADELRGLIVGNTIEGPIRSKPYDFYYRKDGTMGGMITSLGADRGTWRVEDDGKFCQQWIQFLNADDRCYRWYRQGDRYVMRNVDTFRTIDITVWRITEGNPRNF